jgi:hypothetical protein
MKIDKQTLQLSLYNAKLMISALISANPNISVKKENK